MMNALVHTSAAMGAWIPIRERNSPGLPFNFSTERILFVPRDSRGQLIAEAFKDELHRRCRAAGMPQRGKGKAAQVG